MWTLVFDPSVKGDRRHEELPHTYERLSYIHIDNDRTIKLAGESGPVRIVAQDGDKMTLTWTP